MLNIDINVDIKKTRYPIMFNNNTCVACGATGTLKFLDIFGKPVTQEIHALERIQCMACGAKYGIHWVPDIDTKELKPIPTDYDAKIMFKNFLGSPIIKAFGSNKL